MRPGGAPTHKGQIGPRAKSARGPTLARMHFIENRTEPRESLALPLDVGGQLRAVTRDISPSWMYFDLRGRHDLDGPLFFEMHLDDAKVKFTSEGRFVRIEHREGLTGVAVQLVSPQLAALD